MRLFRNVSIHELFVWLHYYATFNNNFLLDEAAMPQTDFAHEGQDFPTWHRLYLLAWERALQEMSGDEYYTIPFWDWTESEKCEICSEELMGKTTSNGDVVGNYFEEWLTICYPLGTNATNNSNLCDSSVKTGKLKRSPAGMQKQINGLNMTLPTKKEVAFALRFEKYDLPPFSEGSSCSFRNLLEGYANTTSGYRVAPVFSTMHNVVHLVFGGVMASVPAASNDPIFLLHHCFVTEFLRSGFESTRKTPLFSQRRKLPLDTTGVTSWYLFSPCIPMKRFSQSLSHLDMTSRGSTKMVCKLFLLTSV